MRLLHLGDLHLGKSLGDFDLYEDQKYMLDRILQAAKEHQVDAVLLAGDIYDKAVPSEAATRLLDYFLCELVRANLPTFIISGNHDSDERLSFGSRLFSAKNIHIQAKYMGKLAAYELQDEFGEVSIHLLPFVKASYVRKFHEQDNIITYDDAVRAVISHAEIDRTKRNVLVGHQFVVGQGGVDGARQIPVLGGSEGIGTQSVEKSQTAGLSLRADVTQSVEKSQTAGLSLRADVTQSVEKSQQTTSEAPTSRRDHSDIASVGTVEVIGTDCFDDFDYVALGHIHAPQAIGREQVRYAGSMLKYSLKEAAGEKSFPIVTLGKKGDVDVELIRIKPLRDLRHIRGPLEKLLAPENLEDTDDYIYATLTDEDFAENVMGLFQEKYPRTVRVDYDNSHTKPQEISGETVSLEGKSFSEFVGEFYRKMYGCEMSEEELSMMRKAAKEAGIEYEAD